MERPGSTWHVGGLACFLALRVAHLTVWLLDASPQCICFTAAYSEAGFSVSVALELTSQLL